MTTEIFSVAYAGAGYFAQFQHAAWQGTKGARLVAAADRAAQKAAVEAHHAAVEATYAAERAASKAEFIAQAMAEGASQAGAEQLASQAGH